MTQRSDERIRKQYAKDQPTCQGCGMVGNFNWGGEGLCWNCWSEESRKADEAEAPDDAAPQPHYTSSGAVSL